MHDNFDETREVDTRHVESTADDGFEDMTDDTKTYEASEKDYTYVKYPSQKKRTEEKPIMRPEPVQHVPHGYS